MAAPWYTPSGTPATSAQGSSSDMRAEFTSIETALDKLPALNANQIVIINASGTAMESLPSLNVGRGGTGAASILDGGIMLGRGTGPVTSLAVLAAGEMIVGDGTTTPGIQSGAALRTSIGLGSLATANSVNNGNWSGTALALANGGTGATSASTARTALGLGSLATVSTINNNDWSGADLAIANGGTGSSSASAARTALGLGTLATVSTINDANWSGTDLSVSNGGTGASILNNGGVLLGSGTNAITAMGVLSIGAMIVGSGGDPVVQSGSTLRTTIGLGTGNTATFAALVVPGHQITTVTGNTTNTRLGLTAGDAIASGALNNTTMGSGALSSLTTGDRCTAFGYNALLLSTGSDNTAVGSTALDAVTTGSQNTGIGNAALSAINTAFNNTAAGYQALRNLTGSNNTGVGSKTGDSLSSGSDNTLLGYNCDTGLSTSTNRIVIGVSILGTANDQVSIGKISNIVSNDFGTDAVWSRVSDIRKKTSINPLALGLDFINDLNVVTYKWRPASEYPAEWNVPEDMDVDTDTIMTGLLAQEVKAALDKADTGVRFPGWKVNPNGEQQISGEAFIFPLINAVQQLTQELNALKVAVNG